LDRIGEEKVVHRGFTEGQKRAQPRQLAPPNGKTLSSGNG